LAFEELGGDEEDAVAEPVVQPPRDKTVNPYNLQRDICRFSGFKV
jgi:hypothetical protein